LRLSIADLRFAAAVRRPIANRRSQIVNGLRFRLRFTQTGDAVAVFALTTFFEKFRAFKTLENIALAAKSGRRAETAML